MPAGETQAQPSGWTVDTLALHLQQQIDALHSLADERMTFQTKAVDAAFLAQQTATHVALQTAKEAVTKAEMSADKRFDAVNAFRAQLQDQAATFMPRAEANVRLDSLLREVGDLADRLNVSAGRSQGSAQLYAWIVGAVGLVVSVIIMANVLAAR